MPIKLKVLWVDPQNNHHTHFPFQSCSYPAIFSFSFSAPFCHELWDLPPWNLPQTPSSVTSWVALVCLRASLCQYYSCCSVVPEARLLMEQENPPWNNSEMQIPAGGQTEYITFSSEMEVCQFAKVLPNLKSEKLPELRVKPERSGEWHSNCRSPFPVLLTLCPLLFDNYPVRISCPIQGIQI